MSSLLLRKLLTIIVAIYWLALFVATHIPVVPEALKEPGADKWAHSIAYAGLAFLLATRNSTWDRLTWNVATQILLVVGVYGIVDELTQIPVGRNAEMGDWLADLRGASVGLGLVALLQIGVGRISRRTRSRGGIQKDRGA